MLIITTHNYNSYKTFILYLIISYHMMNVYIIISKFIYPIKYIKKIIINIKNYKKIIPKLD